MNDLPPAFIAVEGVSKQFATVRAVSDLSFRVEPGEVFALLGPNGAGKTTMVRMLVGIMKPDSGRITFSRTVRSASDLGYLPEERGLYRDQPVLGIVEYFGRLYGMTRDDARREGLAWLERFDLAGRAHDKLETLSKGNQQKIQFITAVLHRPSLLVLDEPFTGLDPLNQEMFLDLIKDLSANGTTVLLSSHQMNLVEQIADHILVLDRGRPALRGTMGEIRARARSREKLVCSLAPGADILGLADHPSVLAVEPLPSGEIAIWPAPDVPLSEVLALIGKSLPVTAINSAHVGLHEIFVQTVGRGGEDPS